ncbi:MAG TPA: hypothetical protein VJQ57_00870 [Acidimicrobiia bacterium]|nr:hypothetical protein [Acidimicrobiia bacterium]
MQFPWQRPAHPLGQLSRANPIGRIGAGIGAGFLAGIAGTAAMTLSSKAEMKLRDRKPSTTPQDAAANLLGLEPRNSDELRKLGQVVHWQYGTSLGAIRGLMSAAALREPLASILFFTAVWALDLAVVPQVADAKPATEWAADELAIDAFHHVVFVGVTALALRALLKKRGR